MEKRIKELSDQIAVLNQELSDLRQQQAEGRTALRVGDRVTYEGAGCVWELRGIRPGYGKEPKFFGAKIKKDGTPGAVVSEIFTPFKKQLVQSDK